MKNWITAAIFGLAIAAVSLPTRAQYEVVQKQTWTVVADGVNFTFKLAISSSGATEGTVSYDGGLDVVSGTVCVDGCTAVNLVRWIPAEHGGGTQTWTGNIAIDQSGTRTAAGTWSGTGGSGTWTAETITR